MENKLNINDIIEASYQHRLNNTITYKLGEHFMLDHIYNLCKSHYYDFHKRFGYYPPMYLIDNFDIIEYCIFDDIKKTVTFGISLHYIAYLLSFVSDMTHFEKLSDFEKNLFNALITDNLNAAVIPQITITLS